MKTLFICFPHVTDYLPCVTTLTFYSLIHKKLCRKGSGTVSTQSIRSDLRIQHFLHFNTAVRQHALYDIHSRLRCGEHLSGE